VISCIVPVYNGERYLAETLQSILGQGIESLDVIVVDDGSTDGTTGVVRRFGSAIRVLHQANAGPAAARNLGLREARGHFVAFLDADDLWKPDKLTRQMARFAARPDLDISLTQLQNFWVDELREEADRLKGHRLAEPTAAYSLVTMLARRRVFDRIGPFDASWKHVHDTEWFMRAGEQGAVMELLPEVLVSRRLHQSNRSRLGAATSREEYLRLVKSRIERGRRFLVP
jgi:glycosyltransferase involved in cell wall biosynthesis